MSINFTGFLNQQLEQWPLASKNYNELERVLRRKLSNSLPDIYLQFNPNRIISSAAKVDAQSIQARPCFLCPANLPAEQIKKTLMDDLQLLVNPYPIFNQHFTIPILAHQSQRIANHFGMMLTAAQRIEKLTIFYNGPKCGASAPDHLHFQAGNRHFLPIEADFESKQFCKPIIQNTNITIYQWNNYLRQVMTIESQHKDLIEKYFSHFYTTFAKLQPNEDEPMLNILSYYESDRWITHLFPRRLHRPTQFFATGNEQILLSPASVDLGGVIILPREEDYKKLSINDIADIFNQICVEESTMQHLCNEFINLKIN